MEDKGKCIAGCLLALIGCLASSVSNAFDEIVNVEIFNATSAVIVPGSDFTWSLAPENAGHSFSISPGERQELTYYLPQARAERESFTYTQGNRTCHFSFGHIPGVPVSDGQTMPYRRWVEAKPAGACVAELLEVEDDDDYVRHGGTRVKFSMKS
ncbi:MULTISPECIES: hypothetical protein [Pseudomonas]|uniref:Lipoprotein n=1 Tax=Pseudomonas fluorescens TaxID=294 RepID=A0A160A345_PSEFL|nr:MULTISPECIES: hypothetical protein [Pseudomonas]AMZ74430.1 hypothetical protein TK06_26175 [Pseudomonas fluorescens]SCW69452.1 hypothetical protein SAMN03159424_02520 [Pseudomonas sp. NFACC05-1]SCZ44565.1 hypothetical protein SAMN03159405_05173 [Pseudomonas sp. NFACC44-2]SDA83841.1 hypothetical protein SAMN03159429_04607 [Pseudomonas sp. NFACC51]SDX72723.1 hypothetical protein SAMN03159474_03711 [Pseudomonas sp. NFACC08-1]